MNLIGKTAVGILLSAVLLFISHEDSFGAGEAEGKAPEARAANVSPPVAAKINGVAITREEVEKVARALLAESPVTATPESRKGMEADALDQLIAVELLHQAGQKLAVNDLDKQVEARVAASRERFPSAEEFQKALSEYGLTEQELARNYRRDIVINNLIEREVTGKVRVADDAVRKFYAENPDRFSRGESVTAGHILIGVDPKAGEEEKKKAREKVVSVREKLLGGGDFAQMAKENSTCPSAAQGGDLGSFGKGEMVPSFEKAAFALKPGEVSDVVETPFGYHVIRVTDRKEAETVKFEEVREKIEEYMRGEATQKGITDLVERLRKGAAVEITK